MTENKAPSVPPLVSRALAFLRSPVHAALVAVWLFLLAASVTVPVDRKGDGSEYILATESLLYDQDLAIHNTVDIFRHLERRPHGMDTPAGLTRMQGTDGVERYGLHSFYYPLLALPFYAAFGYAGFQILNAAAVALMVTLVWSHAARSVSEGAALAFAAGATFLSAAWSYVFWTQADAVYPALVALFLHQWFAGKPLRASLAAGPLVAAQPALGLVVLPMFVELVHRRKFARAAGGALVVGAFVAAQFAYNVVKLGTLLPMNKMGLASLSNLSEPLFVRLVFDPSLGLLWFYPAVVYCLLSMRSTARSWALVGAAFGTLFVMTGVHTFYSHQVGSRYANWVFPIFLFVASSPSLERTGEKLAAAFAVVVGAGLALDPVGNSRDMDVRHKTFLPYRIATALSLQVDNPEVFQSSSDRLVEGRVYTRNVTRDRWTLGGERAEFLLRGTHAGDLVFYVRTWPKTERQRVVVDFENGRRREFSLEPGQAARIELVLQPAEVPNYDRWRSSYTLLSITAEPWLPAVELQGNRPEAHDLRRLGILVERIQNGEDVLFDASRPAR
ncbi:MAG TPA: glycosyltransferase family 87 protein [Polyangiaceae bacterium]|nr:glycosyltransferase family 87 protein [Polyangiaceae bacterium]